MSRPDPQRSWSPIPWGILGAVVLAAVVEHHGLRDILSIQSMDWRHAAHVGVARTRDRDILCFGDSMVKYGVLPRLLEDRTGRPTYNLAIMTGAAPSSYFLLRRALDRGARPSAIVVDFARHLLESGPYTGPRPYPWAEILTLREAAELALRGRDPDLFASILSGKLAPSIRRRFEIRANLMAALAGRSVGERELALMLWRNWNHNQGAQAWADNPQFQDVAPPATAPQPGKWQCDPVNAFYLEQFLKLAESRRIAVYWVIPPVSPNTQAGNEFWGEESRYTAFIRRTQARFPKVVVVDGRRMKIDLKDFQDPIHLDRDGAAAFTLALSDVLQGRRPPSLSEARWVMLPEDPPRPSTHDAEDINQSRLAVQSLKSRYQ